MLGSLLPGASNADERISHGRFEDVQLFRPAGEIVDFIMLFSSAAGWNETLSGTARLLAEHGALVAGIDLRRLNQTLLTDQGDCIELDGDVENLARFVQAYARLPTYFTPRLLGNADGASLVYALLAQAPAGTFDGGVSFGFCPTLSLTRPLCDDGSLRSTPRADGHGVDLLPSAALKQTWITVPGSDEAACTPSASRQFIAAVTSGNRPPEPMNSGAKGAANATVVAAWQALGPAKPTTATTAPPSLEGLPLEEIPAIGGGDTFALMLSGDGGWAGLDKDVATALAAHGLAVVGLDSLRYFWTARTPQGVADDLARIMRHYAARWHQSRVILIGYSQGADVLPFAVNRLPDDARRLLAQTVLIGPGKLAAFEFHVGQWLGSRADGRPVLPEISKLASATTSCIYGNDDDEAVCPSVPAAHTRLLALPGGHHFDGDFASLAGSILAQIPLSK